MILLQSDSFRLASYQILIVQLLVSCFPQAISYNLLFFHGVATSSHRTAIWPLAEKLADLGHNVTYIFPIEVGKRVGSHPNVEEISPSKMVELSKTFVSDFDINIRLENRVDEWLQSVFSLGVNMCEAFYDSEETQKWLSRPNLHYDLVFIDASFGECIYGAMHKLKIQKHVVFIPFVCGLVYDTYGVVPESSSFPDPFFDYTPEMSLVERTWNMIAPLMWRYNILQYISKLEPLLKSKLQLTDMPAITEFEKNTSLVLHNSYFVEEYPVSLPPMYISFAGLRCFHQQNSSSLPGYISEFLADANNFFYVSLGSAVDVSKMPNELLESFLQSFKMFPDTKFLWRWNGPPIKNQPNNILLAAWFPQLDILRHPKIKGFITQGGRPSIQEALCFSVPMISIPVFADQNHNANRMVSLGAAIQLNLNTLTKDNLSNAIREIMSNRKYKDSMIKLSAIFKHRPIDPLENLLFWTDFVIRHESSLLQPPGIKQTWYQRRLLDVYAVLLLIFVTAICTVTVFGIYLLKVFTRMCNNKTKVE